MREIKFRAWDKHEKEMSYSVNVYSESDGEMWWSADHINPETGDTICSFDGKAGVLMQFTGLKDRNGKEIYEGDIWNGKEVKFGSFYAYLENGLGGGYYVTGFYITNNDGIEEPVESGGKVIGNIYENPELLK